MKKATFSLIFLKNKILKCSTIHNLTKYWFFLHAFQFFLHSTTIELVHIKKTSTFLFIALTNLRSKKSLGLRSNFALLCVRCSLIHINHFVGAKWERSFMRHSKICKLLSIFIWLLFSSRSKTSYTKRALIAQRRTRTRQNDYFFAIHLLCLRNWLWDLKTYLLLNLMWISNKMTPNSKHTQPTTIYAMPKNGFLPPSMEVVDRIIFFDPSKSATE